MSPPNRKRVSGRMATLQEAGELLLRNEDPEVFRLATETLFKVLQNLVAHPDEPKYRSLPRSSAAFADKLAKAKGAVRFLKAVGFVEEGGSGAGGSLALPSGAESADQIAAGKACLKAVLKAHTEQEVLANSFLTLTALRLQPAAYILQPIACSLLKRQTERSKCLKKPLTTHRMFDILVRLSCRCARARRRGGLRTRRLRKSWRTCARCRSGIRPSATRRTSSRGSGSMPASKQTRRKMASGARYKGLHATSPGSAHSTHAQTLTVLLPPVCAGVRRDGLGRDETGQVKQPGRVAAHGGQEQRSASLRV